MGFTLTINSEDKIKIAETLLKLKGFQYTKSYKQLDVVCNELIEDSLKNELYKDIHYFTENAASREALFATQETKENISLDELIFNYNLGYYTGRVIELVMNYKQERGVKDLEEIKRLLNKHISSTNRENKPDIRTFWDSTDLSNAVLTEKLNETRFELYEVKLPARKLFGNLTDTECRLIEFAIQANNAIKPVARIQACKNALSITDILIQEFERKTK